MAIYPNRTCTVCGRTFSGGPRAKYCEKCRDEIRKERDRLFKKNGAQRKINSIDYCIICGKSYTVNSGRQKYCSDCSRPTVMAIDAEQGLLYYRLNSEEINKKKRERRRQSKENEKQKK